MRPHPRYRQASHVDGEDLVDQRMITRLMVDGVDLVDDTAHGVGDVAAGQDRTDREAEVALAGAESLQVRELLVVIGAMLKPLTAFTTSHSLHRSLHHSHGKLPYMCGFVHSFS